MSAGAGALGGKAQAAGLGVGERDQVGDRLRGAVEGNREQLGKAPHQRDRTKILDRVVGQRRVERCVGRVGPALAWSNMCPSGEACLTTAAATMPPPPGRDSTTSV